jgi:CheY-like chemotaxis protein
LAPDAKPEPLALQNGRGGGSTKSRKDAKGTRGAKSTSKGASNTTSKRASDEPQIEGRTVSGSGATQAQIQAHDEAWLHSGQDLVEPGPTGVFGGEKVLIVDDDIRNVFALTSVLEQHGLQVLYAENGREGIEVLEQHDDVTVVLMDIMMPEMDGYATTAAIRKMPQFAGLPIIALTAKAMKGDREKSIEAGASDYVTKPVDTDHLLSVMQEWMSTR